MEARTYMFDAFETLKESSRHRGERLEPIEVPKKSSKEGWSQRLRKLRAIKAWNNYGKWFGVRYSCSLGTSMAPPLTFSPGKWVGDFVDCIMWLYARYFNMCFESRVIFRSQLTRKFTTKCPTISRCTRSSTVFKVTSSLTRDLSDRNHVCDFIWEVLESSRNWLRYRESTIIKTTRPHKKSDPHWDSVHNPR